MTPLASALCQVDGQNLSGFSYFELDALATAPGTDRKLISWYNGMFYGGFARGPPVYERVVRAGWDPERVVMTVLDCADNGQPNGWLGLETLGKTVRDLRKEYPGFGGMAGWEYYNAGKSDDEGMQPWEWVKKVGEALFGELPSLGGVQEL
jgi:hypothetical protein